MKRISGYHGVLACALMLSFAVTSRAQRATGDCQIETWEACLAHAEAGDAHAQYIVAGMYSVGTGVTQDQAEAERWYRRAAAQGNAGAQHELGWLYANGVGVESNDAEAVRWFRMAANQGDAAAQVSLGVMYDTGRGVARDSAEAVRWYRRAAAQGNPAAQLNLGTSYAAGDGVRRDYTRAYLWLTLAVDASEAGDRAERAEALTEVAARLTAEQRAKGRADATGCRLSGFKSCGEPTR